MHNTQSDSPCLLIQSSTLPTAWAGMGYIICLPLIPMRLSTKAPVLCLVLSPITAKISQKAHSGEHKVRFWLHWSLAWTPFTQSPVRHSQITLLIPAGWERTARFFYVFCSVILILLVCSCHNNFISCNKDAHLIYSSIIWDRIRSSSQANQNHSKTPERKITREM